MGTPSATDVPIYTIGYGSRTTDEFLAALQAHQISFVIDVRSAPHSRFKPEFSRGPLESFLRAHGIRYVYMGDTLGGQPADRDCYVDDKVVYERVAEKPFFLEGLERLQKAHQQQLCVAVMCSEGKPQACHRTKLIGAALDRLGIPVVHIDEDGRLRSQDEVINDLTDGQLSLFGEPVFKSRKRYRRRDGEPAGGVDDF